MSAAAGARAAAAGSSRKSPSVRCRDLFGLPPEPLAGVLRFAAAVRRLERHPGTPLARIALDCGYGDQAQRDRRFQRFAGPTPTADLAQRTPMPGDLHEPRQRSSKTRDRGRA